MLKKQTILYCQVVHVVDAQTIKLVNTTFE